MCVCVWMNELSCSLCPGSFTKSSVQTEQLKESLANTEMEVWFRTKSVRFMLWYFFACPTAGIVTVIDAKYGLQVCDGDDVMF